MYIQVGFENVHGEVFEVRREHGVVYINGDEFNWEDPELFNGFNFTNEELVALGKALITIGQAKQ